MNVDPNWVFPVVGDSEKKGQFQTVQEKILTGC